jgi:hypothetical protein
VAEDLAGPEPFDDPLEHAQRPAEEEGRLVGVVEIDRRQQRRAGSHMPEQHEQHR